MGSEIVYCPLRVVAFMFCCSNRYNLFIERCESETHKTLNDVVFGNFKFIVKACAWHRSEHGAALSSRARSCMCDQSERRNAEKSVIKIYHVCRSPRRKKAAALQALKSTSPNTAPEPEPASTTQHNFINRFSFITI